MNRTDAQMAYARMEGYLFFAMIRPQSCPCQKRINQCRDRAIRSKGLQHYMHMRADRRN